MKKLAVIIGRFQPFHNSHAKLVEHAFTVAERVYMFLGSSSNDLSLKNPFSNDERTSMIRKSFGQAVSQDKLFTVGMPDHVEDRIWVGRIEKLTNTLAKDDETILVGCKKDESSFYLDLFPYWEKSFHPHDDKVSGTMVRHIYFNKHCGLNDIAPYVPEGTLAVMRDLWDSKRRKEFMRDYAAIELQILKGMGKIA